MIWHYSLPVCACIGLQSIWWERNLPPRPDPINALATTVSYIRTYVDIIIHTTYVHTYVSCGEVVASGIVDGRTSIYVHNNVFLIKQCYSTGHWELPSPCYLIMPTDNANLICLCLHVKCLNMHLKGTYQGHLVNGLCAIAWCANGCVPLLQTWDFGALLLVFLIFWWSQERDYGDLFQEEKEEDLLSKFFPMQ